MLHNIGGERNADERILYKLDGCEGLSVQRGALSTDRLAGHVIVSAGNNGC